MKIFLFIASSFLIFSGCISQTKYKEALFNLEQSRLTQDKLKQENAKMAAEIERLEERNEYIKKLSYGFEERSSALDKYMLSSKNGKDKMFARLAADKQELDDKINKQELEIKGLRDRNGKLSEKLESALNGKK